MNIFNHMKRFLKYVSHVSTLCMAMVKINILMSEKMRGTEDKKIYLGELASYHRSYWVFIGITPSVMLNISQHN